MTNKPLNHNQQYNSTQLNAQDSMLNVGEINIQWSNDTACGAQSTHDTTFYIDSAKSPNQRTFKIHKEINGQINKEINLQIRITNRQPVNRLVHISKHLQLTVGNGTHPGLLSKTTIKAPRNNFNV